jgi:trehalose 6-phosphate phosphatase
MIKSLPSVTAPAAFFIDFDGTLVAIAERPDLTHVEPSSVLLLEGLCARFGDAVAIVSGRPLSAIDAFLAPLKMAVAAEHGAVRRDAQGRVHRDLEATKAVAAAGARLKPFAAAHEGLVLEMKESSAALHYRQRPELRALAERAAEEALAGLGGVQLLRGKMVLEIKPEGIDKGKAIEAFLQETPFRGKPPVMIGDDVTDEYGFRAVNERGGFSIKIGAGDTAAAYRTEREGFLRWLAALAGVEP